MSIEEAMQIGGRLAEAYRFKPPDLEQIGKLGSHHGSAAGAGIDYKDFREYQPGDDVRRIDWHAYARSDRLIVKLYHEETAPHLDLFLDLSRSMDLAGTAKATASRALIAFFHLAARASGFTTALNLLAEQRKRIAPVMRENLMEPWLFTAQADPGRILDTKSPLGRKNGVRIFVSDFMWPHDPKPICARMARDAATTVFYRVVGEQEQNPGLAPSLRVRDVETNQVLDVRLDEQRQKAYRERYENHRRLWLESCRRFGILFVETTAESFLAEPAPRPDFAAMCLTVN